MRQKIAILPQLYDANGNIKKKWHVYFSYRNPKTNKMHRFRIYDGFATLYTKKARYAHAEQMIRQYTDRIQQGWNPFETDLRQAVYEDNLRYATTSRIFREQRSGNLTFNYYSNLFLPEIKGMADKTYKNYVSKYRMFDAWLARHGHAGNDLSSITQNVMRNFFLYLINDEKLARITVMKYRHMLERFFNWCVKSKYLKLSPCTDLPDTTRENDQAPRPIHEADIDKLVQAIKDKDPQLWLTIQLEYYCFMRPGLEIRLARVGWFDLARGTISVPKEVVKTNADKVVIIPDEFRDILLSEFRLQMYPAHYYLIGPNGIPGTRALGSNTLRNRFNVIRDALKLPRTYKLYSWKHTGISRAIDSGVPAYHLQKQNGHASMGSFEKYLKNKIGFKSEEIKENFPSL